MDNRERFLTAVKLGEPDRVPYFDAFNEASIINVGKHFTSELPEHKYFIDCTPEEVMKFYEVQKYFTIVNYQVHPDPFFVNLPWYEGLPGDLKNIFDAVAKAAIIYSDTVWLSSEQDYVNFLDKKLRVNVISPENRKLFVKEVKPVWTHYINQGLFTQAEIDEALAIAAGK